MRLPSNQKEGPMPGRLSQRPDISALELDGLVEKIASVPDKLVAVQLYLQPLCDLDGSDIPVDAKQAIAEACSILQSAIVDLMEIVRHSSASPSLDGKR